MTDIFKSLELLIEDNDIEFEECISKDVENETLWLEYYKFKSSSASMTLANKIFILNRAVNAVPSSLKLWRIFLDVVLEESKGEEGKIDNHNKGTIDLLYRRALASQSTCIELWIEYLAFQKKYNPYKVSELRRAFNECLVQVPIAYHGEIWPLYLAFAEEIGGQTALITYKKYLQFKNYEIASNIVAGSEYYTLDELILKIASLGDLELSFVEFEDLVYNPEKQIRSSRSLSKIWELYLEVLTSNEEESSTYPNSKLRNDIINYLFKEGIKRFPDLVSIYCLRTAKYFEGKDDQYTRHLYESGLRNSLNVHDFTGIFNAYIKWEESNLSEMQVMMDNDPRNEDLGTEFDFLMDTFDGLLSRREIMLSDLKLRNDINNLDSWFDRISIYEMRNELTKVLESYASAITSVNPLEAHSGSHNTQHSLPQLWIAYADFYRKREDFKTAEIIFSKAVRSTYKTVDQLAEIYIGWSSMYLGTANEDKGIEIIASALIVDSYEFSYGDLSLSIQERLPKCIKLWSFYLDLLESSVEDKGQKDKIQKVIIAYNKLMDAKVATPLSIVNFSNFLEEFEMKEDSFIVFEKGVKYFKDFSVSIELWKVYLSKASQAGLSLERLRDIFDRCLYNPNIELTTVTSCKVYTSLFLDYSKMEMSKAFFTKAISCLNDCIRILTNEANKSSINGITSCIVAEKVEVYKQLEHNYLELKDNSEIRKFYVNTLEDKQLTTPNIISFGKKFIDFESLQNEPDRVRSIFRYLCESVNKNSSNLNEIWKRWEEFELNFGNESTFKDLLRFKRSFGQMEESTKIEQEIKSGFIKYEPSESKGEPSTTENPDAIDIEM